MPSETMLLPVSEDFRDDCFQVRRLSRIRRLEDGHGNSMFGDGNTLSFHDAFQQLG
jgi:hypothetical protein